MLKGRNDYMKKLLSIFVTCFILINTQISVWAVAPQFVEKIIQTDGMKNADFAIIVKDLKYGQVIYDYNIKKGMVPASTLKTVTTATALEILGPDYRYETFLQYDGKPTLGSEYFENKTKFLDDWTKAIRELGISEIMGSVIADESIFDNQGIHPKWQAEDLGVGYGAGSYGINIFDNKYRLYLKAGELGTKPVIESTAPEVKLNFVNTLTVSDRATGASIFGVPFSSERYLHGSLSPKSSEVIEGDIPDPALYTANLLTDALENAGILVRNEPTCNRFLPQSGALLMKERHSIMVTYSPALKEIIQVTNHVSHNLYADSLLKTIGTLYSKTDQPLTSFDKGIEVLKSFWEGKGIICPEILYDGSGLTAVNIVTAEFISKVLEFMAVKSINSKWFMDSLPTAGADGTVSDFLCGTCLQGKAKIKGGSMTKVRCYAGYITKEDESCVVGVFANNYRFSDDEMDKVIEEILLDIFS